MCCGHICRVKKASAIVGMGKSMRGQWIGTFEGASKGDIVVEVDDVNGNYIGYAYLFDTSEHSENTPAIFASFATNARQSPAKIEAALHPVDPSTLEHTTWAEYIRQYGEGLNKAFGEGFVYGTVANADLTWSERSLSISWRTNVNTEGVANLKLSEADQPSNLTANPMSWNEFKNYLENIEFRRFLFRGQRTSKRLRTYFHRTGRTNMFRFLNEDIPALHRQISSRSKHIFQIRDPEQLGAFCNLVQHHGYPTPLLDWTYSPYVAAYFAYHKISNKEASEESGQRVRIYEFDSRLWLADMGVIPKLAVGRRHFSLLEFPAIENERMAPQQAVSSITNMDDIEWYIAYHEKLKHKQYLKVFDLPVFERSKVMRELSLMGITARSLFPGLDGICEEIKERLFDV